MRLVAIRVQRIAVAHRSIDMHGNNESARLAPERAGAATLKLYLGRMLGERKKICLLHYRVAV